MNRIIVSCLLAMLSLGAFAQQPNTAVNPYPRTITVSGSAEMEIVPDEIYVIVDLKEYDKKGTGRIPLDKIKTDFLSNCRSIGLADSVITIASYEGYSANPWLRKRTKRDDLVATISYQVKFSDSRKMDELVDKLDDDATVNFRIVRTSHSKITEYRKQLKIQAIKAAKDKAIYLTETINEQVGAAITIQEPKDAQSDSRNYSSNVSHFSSQAIVYDKNSKSSDDIAPSQDFQKFKLRFEVNVVFALK